MKKYILPIVCVLVCMIVAVVLCVRCGKSVVESYVPLEEFRPAYEALARVLASDTETEAQGDKETEAQGVNETEAKGISASTETSTEASTETATATETSTSTVSQTSPGHPIIKPAEPARDIKGTEAGELYDLEETIRILNGLEIAQSESADFQAYLEYLSRQDYSAVPKEVVKAKMELLPILQEMYVLEKENEDLTGLTSIFNSLGTGLYTVAYESKASDFATLGLSLTDFTFGKILALALNLGSLEKAKTEAFNDYAKKQKLKKENLKKIEQLKKAYLDYLNNFSDIYMKYMREWDRLCLEKDKAYLAVYSGRAVDGYETSREILQKHPGNREAMLLQALSCINLAAGTSAQSGDRTSIGMSSSRDASIGFALEAERILDNYLDMYPSKAAPALVLQGQLAMLRGQQEKAMSYYDQAAMEYPKQAEELKDMLNSYALRTYLSATPEGHYLLRLYRSTMEGYGWFSPNFQKALYWDAEGDSQKASTEIYNHFFRRNSQGLYDCLLSDMEFCENNLYKSFKSQFMESSALNMSISECKHIFGKNGVTFTLTNRSDLTLENVRLFACLHLKGMYMDEYRVVPCDALNILEPGQSCSWDNSDYTVDDVVRVRAILMTDDRVCWVDDINFKQSKARKNAYQPDADQTRSLDMFGDFGISESNIQDLMHSSVSGYGIVEETVGVGGFFKGMVGKDKSESLRIEVPRTLCLIDPVFSLGELGNGKTPASQVLAGSVIRLDFAHKASEPYLPLYVYSDFVNLKIDYQMDDDGTVKVTSVSMM